MCKKYWTAYLLLIGFTFMSTSCFENQNRNHLAEEKSPYLQQHKDNPIWWFAWGEEALSKAKKEDKLVFLSVGYSTCHWCHVMEHESFESNEVAKMLNDSFVSIKVDREERPDVDSIYMDAVQAMTGSGGWPMSVVMTPEGKPVFAGTYLPTPNFLRMLTQVNQAWQDKREKVLEAGENVANFLREKKAKAFQGEFKNSIFTSFLDSFKEKYDEDFGGYEGKPKFPPSYGARVLLRIHRRTQDAKALEMASHTLNEIARGGIYDHLAGGFHRYSTDEQWIAPHFEKMLYDQAALVQAYLEAFQSTGNKEYELVVRETLEYLTSQMTHSEGGYFSAEDADSEGEEGKFYVYTLAELDELLSEAEFKELDEAFPVSAEGNFENRSNILVLSKKSNRVDRKDSLKLILNKLKSYREQRPRPLRDEKVLTSWNGLMIAAVAKAGLVLGDSKYVLSASRAAEFILKHLKTDTLELKRRWIDGEAKYDAYLNDYAFFIHALLELYQASGEVKWLNEAEALQAKQDELFWDKKESGYFSTNGRDQTLIRREKEYFDNVVPSGNSISAINLLLLSDLTLKLNYRSQSLALMQSVPDVINRHPSAFSQWLIGIDYLLDRSKEIAIVANMNEPATRDSVQNLLKDFHPNRVVAVGESGSMALLKNKTAQGNKMTFFVCEQNSCQFPTTDLNKAKELIATYHAY